MKESKRKCREASKETKQKMSLKKQGINNPMYGKKMPDEVKRKISKKLIAYWQTIPSNNESNK